MFKVKTTSIPQVQMCQACGVKPRYYEKTTGKLHPFCGKTCASKVPKMVTVVCDHCQRRPTSGSHLYCGETCATAARLKKKSETCSLTGCTKRATMYPIGSYWNYCSAGHEELALRGCICCRAVPYIGNYFPLCASCDSYLVGHGPFLLPVPQDHTTYWAVVDQFNAAWAHPTERPQIRMVYRIIPAPSVWDNYWAYSLSTFPTVFPFGRDVLEAKKPSSEQWEYPGNEHLLWHGTTRACDIGEGGQNVFCTSPKCSLCSIARGSFNVASAGKRAFQRYGPGIYTSSKSSKSDHYAKNEIKSPWKALLLNNVLAGVEYTTVFNERHLKGPPLGYDSVYGKPGLSLNYDELVVYTDHAIRPAYLVMYEFTHKSILS
ncbi:ADP-ribosylation [Thelephora ganbajun]|uniref:ADP-ribosylation n=1 Tax=Thelephora ganbajun TaxID=370292 RepID=A0ACB6ZGY4_THEGA|nr:ADP-ribosylation [Thelephora ganbajun]